MIFKIRKSNLEDQKRWKDDYNDGFLSFPGGMLDWAAFGVMLIIFFSIISILLILFDLETGLFKSKAHLAGLFIVIAGLIYYVIYFKNMPWIKEKIRAVNTKYFL